MNKKVIALQVSIAAAAAMAGPVAAQEKNSAFALEEVVVTAQKRTESAQDVPISIQTFSASAIDRLGANVLSDLSEAAPSLELGGLGKGSQQQMGMRGVVDFARNVGIDSRMGVYIDGVFQGRSYNADVPLLGLESVEILRGPQGTLFGKNTVTGAISLNTKRPSEEFQAQVGAEAGNNDMVKTTGYVNGPITDKLSGSLSGSYQEAEGYYKNLTLGEDVGDWDTSATRGQLLYTPTEKLDLLLSGDYAKKHSDYPLRVNASLEPYRTLQNFKTQDDTESWGSALTADYSLDNDYTLTSITAYRYGKFDTIADDDYTPIDGFDANFNEESDQWSQELRLASPVEEKYDWVGGLYYFWNDLSTDRNIYIGPELLSALSPPPLAPFADALSGYTEVPSKLNVTSYAAYFHGNYRFTEAWELTAGIRYNHEEKDVKWQQNNLPADPAVAAALEAATGQPLTQMPGFALGAINYPVYKDDLSDDDWSPTVGLNYFLNDEVMFYSKYSRGHKSGGWNADFMTGGLDNFSYEPESVDSYELGVKSTLLDDTLRLNADVWLAEYDDFQVFQRIYNTSGNPSTQLTNAGKVTNQGMDMEVTWIPIDRLQFTLNAAYLDTNYDKFENADGADYKDNELPFAPEWKTYVGVQYIQPLGDVGELAFNVDYSYTDEQYTDPGNLSDDQLDSYDLINGRVTYTPASQNWELAVWGKNLADDDYERNTTLNALRTRTVSWGTPLTYGVTFNYFFGS